ncbi:hypothetical protein VE03_03132 [Pseudogymnoascus sp. 23342-1-I1]|nr:hypothetical protein VE03_03132 [Pseudogymnoascus sp. 23342-1-I1]
MDDRQPGTSSLTTTTTTNQDKISAVDSEDTPNIPPDKNQIPPTDTPDWADNDSVTTDEDNPLPPSPQKNIHARRYTLTSKGADTFLISGGRKPKELRISRSMFQDHKLLTKADFVLERLYLTRSPGRNGHVSAGIVLADYASRTLETMREEFLHYQELWVGSPAYTSLRTTIRALKDRQESYVPIDNVVCLALGSLQSAAEACRAASFTQLAALLTIMELLDLDPQTTPNTFTAQDPLFTPLDATFLSTLGFTAVPDPSGFLAITPTTLVYCIAGYLDMDWVISRGPWPAALVCGDIAVFIDRIVEEKKTEGRRLVCPTEGERGEILGMVGGCDVSDLVGEGEVEAWDTVGRQRVYWRRKCDG